MIHKNKNAAAASTKNPATKLRGSIQRQARPENAPVRAHTATAAPADRAAIPPNTIGFFLQRHKFLILYLFFSKETRMNCKQRVFSNRGRNC
jgi:hypothetical protein